MTGVRHLHSLLERANDARERLSLQLRQCLSKYCVIVHRKSLCSVHVYFILNVDINVWCAYVLADLCFELSLFSFLVLAQQDGNEVAYASAQTLR